MKNKLIIALLIAAVLVPVSTYAAGKIQAYQRLRVAQLIVTKYIKNSKGNVKIKDLLTVTGNALFKNDVTMQDNLAVGGTIGVMNVDFADTDITALDATTLTGGSVYYNVADTKLYMWTGTAWVDLSQTSTLGDTIESSEVTDDTIAAADIATDAITTTEILDGTVAAADIATDAVTTTEILDGTVVSADIAADTIVAADIATDAVTTTEILDGTVVAADIATDGVATAEILDGTVASADIATDTIAAADIATDAVTTTEILDGTVASADIATDTIVAADIATDAVTTTEILDGTVASADIATDTIVAADIATDGVATAEILDGTVLSADIAVDTIVAADIATDAVTTTEILDGTVASADIATDTIVAADIATDAVTTTEILDDTIAAADIANVARYISFSLGSFIECDTNAGTAIGFDATADRLPDFDIDDTDGTGVVIRFDDVSGTEDQDTEICNNFTVPIDYATGGGFRIRVKKDAHTAGATEKIDCAVSVNGAALQTGASVTTSAAASTSYNCNPTIASLANADSVSFYLSVTTDTAIDDTVDIASVAFFYNATQ